MSLAIVYSRASAGIEAPLVTVEVNISPGMPRFFMVGLPETEVKESRDRVYCAVRQAAFQWPTTRKTINLAPADLPKEGGRFDLPIALGLLAASQQISPQSLNQYEFVGELALSGELRPVRGILSAVLAAQRAGRTLIIPEANAAEASLVKKASVYHARHLLEVCSHLMRGEPLKKCEPDETNMSFIFTHDMADVSGQPHAKRALEVTAAGQHSLLLIGPPGTGKTMLANRLPTILPPLTEDEALEVATLTSMSSQGFHPSEWRKRPFRSPHHTSSSVALVGGGRPPKPGEISLAHHGILFMDEMPEFNRQVLEALREPLESGQITISRASYQAVFPAQFQLIATMNPCPCGYAGHQNAQCHCTEDQIKRYVGKLSGPLLDRIDMQVEVSTLPSHFLLSTAPCGEKSDMIKERVSLARERQWKRQGKYNYLLSNAELQAYCRLDRTTQQLLEQMMQKFNFSMRAYYRILKVARTIADLENHDGVLKEHISEALSYRHLNRSKLIV